MDDEQKILNLLGLATRARQTAFGEDQILKAIRKNEAKLVILVTDIGVNTKKSLVDKSTYYNVPYCFFSTTEKLSQAVGKKRVAVAIVDEGFAKKIQTLLD